MSAVESLRAEIAGEIRAEIAAFVLKELVTLGEFVSPGDCLMLVESMKMEMPVLSDVHGRVSRLVPLGTAVREGDLLAVVDTTIRQPGCG